MNPVSASELAHAPNSPPAPAPCPIGPLPPCLPALLPSCSVFEELFGGLLAPDEVVFAVMLRGYGSASERPQWNEISSVLQRMERDHGIMPSTGGWPRGAGGMYVCMRCPAWGAVAHTDAAGA